MRGDSVRVVAFSAFIIAVLCLVIVPAGAINGTISIAYRGSGGSYLGDTVIFDGYNTFSNTTLIRMTGPGLPSEGVPVYDMNGKAGSGNVIPVNERGVWKFAYYTSSIKGIEKLQTARYYFTVFDQEYPDKTATTSILLKKPEFYMQVSPNIGSSGDYVQLSGMAEKSSSSVHFTISDESGKVIHAYDSSVSATGYFNKGFHIDMAPGIYTITMSSPSVKYEYVNYLTVNPPGLSAVVVPEGEGSGVPSSPIPEGPGTLVINSNPAGATVYIDTVMAGLTPYTLNGAIPGTHTVDIRAPGYLTYSQQVLVKSGETTTIDPVLVKGSAPTPLSPLTLVTALLISLISLIAINRKQS